MRRYITCAALMALLSGPAASAVVPYPNPVLTEYGLVLALDQRGHPAYRPIDGLDTWLAGKAGHLLPDPGPSWVITPARQRSNHTSRVGRPAFALPGYFWPGYGGADENCCRAPAQPTVVKLPRTPPAIPLPASFWMLLGGFFVIGALCSPATWRMKR